MGLPKGFAPAPDMFPPGQTLHYSLKTEVRPVRRSFHYNDGYRSDSIRSRAMVASRRTSSGTVIWLDTCPASSPSSTHSR